MGSGKTTVLGEASDLLASRGVVHAVVDLDAFGTVGLAPDASTDLIFRTLAGIYGNVRAAGVDQILLAEAVDGRETLDRLRDSMPDSEFVICRLIASIRTMQARLRTREPGMLQAEFLSRSAALDRALDDAAVEQFQVSNQDRAVTDVALEMLQLAGWLPRNA